MGAIGRLTARGVDAKLKRGRYADGGGLVLQVSRWGTKAWVFRYQREGRERHMGLGPAHTLGLADARERARECRRILLDGRDPIELRDTERMSRRVEASRGVTFTDCAEKYIEAHQSSWGNAQHRRQWGSSLATYVYPAIGDLSVSAIDTGLVLKCIEPIWSTKAETATRVRGRIESILDWATVRGYRKGDNPARWRGHIDKLLPPRSRVQRVKHLPAMPYGELPAFLVELRASDATRARALELTILTAVRTNETIGAQWSEFDFSTKVWSIPAARMKGKREHRIPLSQTALAVLARLPRSDGLVFLEDRPGRPLGSLGMLKQLSAMGRSDVTVHGFRSTFRDWAAETTGYPNHVIEMALAHSIGDKVEAAYRRGDLFEKRRRLMEEWARYCGRTANQGGVTVLQQGSRG